MLDHIVDIRLELVPRIWLEADEAPALHGPAQLLGMSLVHRGHMVTAGPRVGGAHRCLTDKAHALHGSYHVLGVTGGFYLRCSLRPGTGCRPTDRLGALLARTAATAARPPSEPLSELELESGSDDSDTTSGSSSSLSDSTTIAISGEAERAARGGLATPTSPRARAELPAACNTVNLA